MIKKKKIILLGFFLISTVLVFAEGKSPVFKQIFCSINVKKNNPQKFSLEIADNEQKRSYGLMNRKDMKPNSGMLFVWKDSQI